MKPFLAAAALALVLSGCLTTESTWLDTDGKTLPQADHRKSVKGFGGMLIITPDADWKQKWAAHRKGGPEFTPATVVHDEQPVYTMILLSNAGIGRGGKADVACDIRIRRPDGVADFEETGNACYRTDQTGEAGDIFLSAAVVEFIAESTDPRGQWTVEVTLNDKVRGMAVPLKRSFVVE